MSSRPSRGAARLAAILDALPDGLVLVNANGTVVNANTIALEMFETPGTALVGRGLLDLLPEFDSKLIPGSMRRADSADERGRTKPTRMVARRTDGGEFPAEVTSASLEDGRDAYNDAHSYTGDELLMLVVRDLSGTMDTEAELARSQRQTEMILRAASEGVVGTDTDGRVVLVNPAAAQILGFRATDLGGRELHTLVLHSRADGEPFPYADSPLADTLRSGRKHRVRGQVLWAKNGSQVPVDLTTAPVRDGDQLVGAVMTFTDRRAHEELVDQHTSELAEAKEQHAAELAETKEKLTAALRETTERLTAELTGTTDRLTAELAEAKEQHAAELADRSDRYAAEIEELAERHGHISARHAQLTAVLGDSLRGPLEELRGELMALAADPAGQLWPEANQILHHLAAGYARMTTLVDNVLGYQRLDAGTEQLTRSNVLLDGVVAAGVEGAIELIGPGRAQFAVHAPPIEAQVDAGRLATALAHLVADVAGVDSTGRARLMPGGYVDSTIVVAAAQRGDVVRIEVRGPFAGGDPVHEPIVRGIVAAHGGVLQTHQVPGMSGSAYVLELPLGEGAGTVPQPEQTLAPLTVSESVAPETAAVPRSAVPAQQDAGTSGGATSGGGRRRARRASTDAFLEAPAEPAEPTGRRRARAAGTGQDSGPAGQQALVQGQESDDSGTGTGVESSGTGRRRGRPNPAESAGAPIAVDMPANAGSAVALPGAAPSEGSVVTAAEGAHPNGRAARGTAVPPRGVPMDAAPAGAPRGGRHGGQTALPALPAGSAPVPPPAVRALPAAREQVPAAAPPEQGAPRTPVALPAPAGQAVPAAAPLPAQPAAVRRPRRALAAPAKDRNVAEPAAPEGPRSPFALPPAAADRTSGTPGPAAAARAFGPESPLPGLHDAVQAAQDLGRTLPQPHPVQPDTAPSGRRRGPAETGVPGDTAPPGWGTPAHGFAMPPAGFPDSLPGRPGRDDLPPGPDTWAPPGQDEPGSRTGAVSNGPDTPTTSGFGVMTEPPGWPAGPGTIASENTGNAGHSGHSGADAPAGRDRRTANSVPSATDTIGDQVTADTVSTQGTAGTVGAQVTPSLAETAVPLPAPPAEGAAHQPLPPAQPLPEETPAAVESAQGRAYSVRTLGQGVPFAEHITQQQNQPGASLGSGRRRKLGTPPDAGHPAPDAVPHPQPRGRTHAQGQTSSSATQGGSRLAAALSEGRSYTIGAPDEGAEGPQALDGPGGAVEVANRPQPRPVDDELPPEPLDNPRRLLVWPAPDVSTQQALSERGYRPVVVHSREEVDAQIAAFPAALFIDPLTGPITRTALQSLRQAAVAAEVPVLVTAGLGQATREEAYGADPAVLLKALAPRDSEQHPSRVLLVEGHEEIAVALTETLERRGMQVARAADDNEAVALAGQMRPNLVVMDLMQVRRQRAGIIDWLRANGQLNRTPLIVYTSAGISEAELPRLSSGESALFLAERSTSPDVQARIVELLAKIGTN